MLITDLAAACRSTGLDVVEEPGWLTRGHGPMSGIQSIICHHTAGPKTGELPSLATVRDGRPDLAGPLAQLMLGRSGTVYVIAAGLCWHAGVVFEAWQSNAYAIGIEAEATGVDPWPPVQYEAYARLCAGLARWYRLPLPRVLGHKEVASPLGRKSDPNFDMAAFRATCGDSASTAATAATTRKDDPVAPIPFQALTGGAWRAAVKVEAAATGSQVVAQQWITYSSLWGDGSWKITALDGAGAVIDGGKTVPIANNSDHVYDVPAKARTVTLEVAGGTPAAALISKPA